MFRECYFEYAGKSSQPYNLTLAYISNASSEFNSGGGFDLKTDTLTRSHETLLYGKDYSAQPLAFEVEIINLDDYIPLEQFTEIKNWLFGQDGWKTLKLIDERQDYCLKCIFEPIEDIVDGIGYRGVRCNIRNISPFWYGEQQVVRITKAQLDAAPSVTISGDSYVAISINIDQGDAVDMDITPIIEIGIDARSPANTYQISSPILISAIDNSLADSAIATHTVNSATRFTVQPIGTIAVTVGGYTSPGDATDLIAVSTQYGCIIPQNYNTSSVSWRVGGSIDSQGSDDLLYLRYGENTLRILNSDHLSVIRILYTPVYRLGAF